MKPIDFPAPATVCAALLLTLACGCSQGRAIAGDPSSAPRTVDVATAAPESGEAALKAFVQRIGVSCEQEGMQSCITGKIEVGDYLDVDLRPGCGSGGLYGVVSARSADLRDRAAPLDRRTVATVASGQPLCIEAIGRAGNMPAYYYVRAQPTLADVDCDVGNTCSPAGTTQIHWVDPTIDDCAPSERAAGQERCAAGWIDAEAVRLITASK